MLLKYNKTTTIEILSIRKLNFFYRNYLFKNYEIIYILNNTIFTKKIYLFDSNIIEIKTQILEEVFK
jgi:hypothetical protein